jgi:hypothetical protein
MKYVLHTIEIRTGEQWENKGVFLLYSDLILGFFRVLLYMIFMIVMMKIHTFPLFAIRPMFIAMKYLFIFSFLLYFVVYFIQEHSVNHAVMLLNHDELFVI